MQLPFTVVLGTPDDIATAVAAKVVAALKPQFDALTTKENQMALDLTNLTNAVNNEKTVEQSAITLIQGLAAQIQTLINNSGNTVDPAALQALVDQMTGTQTTLAAAVTANTPAAPAPPATPPAA